MEKVSDREKALLDIIIKEYINKAKPVSSDYLKKRYKLKVSPATIRNDMYRLSKGGYLSKLYTSAGRIPTTKAYRLFVQEILEEPEEKSEDFENIIREIQEIAEDDFQFLSLVTKSLAEYSCSFAFTYYQNHLYKEGWKEIIKNPELSQTKSLEEFLKILEKIEPNIEELAKDSFEIKVYIGKEKNVNLKDFSLIIGNTVFSDNQKAVLALMGPERMKYDKNIEIINSLIKALEKK